MQPEARFIVTTRNVDKLDWKEYFRDQSICHANDYMAKANVAG